MICIYVFLHGFYGSFFGSTIKVFTLTVYRL
nr:MAG TPA: hypothetical protein [Caudoviricetes sp.]